MDPGWAIGAALASLFTNAMSIWRIFRPAWRWLLEVLTGVRLGLISSTWEPRPN